MEYCHICSIIYWGEWQHEYVSIDRKWKLFIVYQIIQSEYEMSSVHGLSNNVYATVYCECVSAITVPDDVYGLFSSLASWLKSQCYLPLISLKSYFFYLSFPSSLLLFLTLWWLWPLTPSKKLILFMSWLGLTIEKMTTTARLCYCWPA